MVNFSMSIKRKLAVIMFTDIAGYTVLSAKDVYVKKDLESGLINSSF